MLGQGFEAGQETSGGTTINQAMVKRECEGHDGTRHNRAVDDNRLLLHVAHSQNRRLWVIDNGNATATAKAADIVQREGATGHFWNGQAALLRSGDQMLHALRNLDDAQSVGIAYDRHKQSFRRINGNTDVIDTFVDDGTLLLIETGIEDGILFQHRDKQLDEQRHIGQAYTAL